MPGWDTEAQQEERTAAALPRCLRRTSNGSEKINSFVALNWEGKGEKKADELLGILLKAKKS